MRSNQLCAFLAGVVMLCQACVPANQESPSTTANAPTSPDFCAQWLTEKDCAEHACGWMDRDQRCVDPRTMQARSDDYGCRRHRTKEACDAQQSCSWVALFGECWIAADRQPESSEK